VSGRENGRTDFGSIFAASIIGAVRKSSHTPEYAELRAALSKARDRAGLSQRALAAKLSVPHSWIAKVESGERRIDAVELVWFLNACGADPVSVFSEVVRSIGIKIGRRPKTASRRGKGE
jgi:DNA-binding transcriptional regulator YiaG